MTKIKLKLKDGTIVTVMGQKFTRYIDNIGYQFAYHAPYGSKLGLQVSHVASGMKVCDASGLSEVVKHGTDDLGKANAALDNLLAKVGSAKFRSVIAGASLI